MYAIMLSRRVFRCLGKISLNLSLVYIKLSASRHEDYEEVQKKLGLPAHKFLKHVESRWLTLAPALLQIIEQFDGLKQYSLIHVPAKQPSILHNRTYKKINDQIKSKDILAEIHFVVAVADIFSQFLVLFQKDKSLTHILNSECVSLVLTIRRRFLK